MQWLIKVITWEKCNDNALNLARPYKIRNCTQKKTRLYIYIYISLILSFFENIIKHTITKVPNFLQYLKTIIISFIFKFRYLSQCLVHSKILEINEKCNLKYGKYFYLFIHERNFINSILRIYVWSPLISSIPLFIGSFHWERLDVQA